MMGERDRPRAGAGGNPPECRVTRMPGRRLGRIRPERKAFDFEWNRIPYGSITHPVGDLAAPFADAMVDVPDDEVEAMIRGSVDQKVEKRQRVRPAGHSHERPSRRRRKLGQVATESFDQGHTAT